MNYNTMPAVGDDRDVLHDPYANAAVHTRAVSSSAVAPTASTMK
jgi:hypothetical protein